MLSVFMSCIDFTVYIGPSIFLEFARGTVDGDTKQLPVLRTQAYRHSKRRLPLNTSYLPNVKL